MSRLIAQCVTAAALAALCGCASQEIIQREFYEPTDQTILEREDKLKVGALKSETIKTGQPDWSAKTISVISVGK